MASALQEAKSFVGTLAALQESEKLLATNRQAADEALEQVATARRDAAKVKADAAALMDEAKKNFAASAAKAEEMHSYAEALRRQANEAHDAHVSGAVDAAKARVRDVENDIALLQEERRQCQAAAVEARSTRETEEKLLADVRKQVNDLRLRLTL